MKGLITPALYVLLLYCASSVHGESISEHNVPSSHENSPLPVAIQEEKYLYAHVVDRNVGKGPNSNYKEPGGDSSSLDSSSRLNDGLEIESSIIGGEQPQFSMSWNHLGGLSHDLFDDPSVADLPCPVAAAIAPCICFYDADLNIDLDCSLVESEEQLANVFQQAYPVKDLRGFNMSENSAIRVLDNILNGVTFRSVNLSPGPFALEAISEYFLLNMKKTLGYFKIYNSKLTSGQFPFAILDEMTALWHFQTYQSQITWIPKIQLPNVTYLLMQMGLIDYIENGTFPIRADQYTLGIEMNVIERVEPGSIYYVDENSMTSNKEILIDVSRSRLKTLEAGTVPMRNGYMWLRFYENQISSVAPGAFVMPEITDNLSIKLELNLNLLTTIDEEVYGELMPYLITLDIYDNPLTCGCDIAWVITNPDYIARIDLDATCADGTNMHNLDPADYLTLC